MLRKWEDLPNNMKNDSVKKYYDVLSKKRLSLLLKRVFDFIVASTMIFILLPLFVVLSIAIKADSKGPIFFTQIRVTQYGRKFRIIKFRTMINNAEKIGSQVTKSNDMRVTKIGKVLRKYRLDEIPQLLNIIVGDMTLVGTRPEVVKYVHHYSDEMMATLLLPAGVTSKASIEYKDEERLLTDSKNVDNTYIRNVLPTKMKINLSSLDNYSFLSDIKIMLKTIFAVMK